MHNTDKNYANMVGLNHQLKISFSSLDTQEPQSNATEYQPNTHFNEEVDFYRISQSSEKKTTYFTKPL